jgi:heterodisulfide reductase subunit A
VSASAERPILIVGGGIAGTAAALHVAAAGRKALLVEDAPALGGAQILLDKTFPTDSCGLCFMAPDPPALCPFLECEAEPRIQIRTLTRLSGLKGGPGAFTATLSTSSRQVDAERCTACGQCAAVCPEVAPAGHLQAEWLGETHAAIYLPFPQAVPRAYVIDPEACSGCGACKEVCPTDAIHLDRPTTTAVEVASVILAPGFGPNNPRLRGAYGYEQHANVVTSLEYERMLSTSSRGGGIPFRPSDDRPAERVAIIQCAGSRDTNIGVPYCSAACCMIAAKQASLTLRRSPDAQVTLFTMDVRAAGRGYEEYVRDLQATGRATYRRSLVSSVKLEPATKDLRLLFAEDGRTKSQVFDLVVLQVGMIVPASVRVLAQRLGVETDEYGFARTPATDPVATSRAGVFVAGTFREPKDVPSTAAEAMAAAAAALRVAGGARALEEPVSVSSSRRAPLEPPRIGVFLDSYDPELSLLDLPAVAETIRSWPEVVLVAFACDGPAIRAAVDEHHLTHVVAGGDSGRDFNARLSCSDCTAAVTLVGLGSTALFVNADARAAQRTALGLLRQAVEHARWSGAEASEVSRPEPRALVLGAGVAGLLAARKLAEFGFETHVLEAAEQAGGWLAQRAGSQAEWAKALAKEVVAHGRVQMHCSSELGELRGHAGCYHATLDGPDGQSELAIGAVIVATGAEPGDIVPPVAGAATAVVSQDELETRLSDWKQRVPDPAASPGSVVMLQCCGTRNESRPYCSRTCCIQAMRNALEIRALIPQTDVTIVYRDIVTPGLAEELYRRARQAGVHFVRRSTAEPAIETGAVRVDDIVLGGEILLPADLVVQSTGIVPAASTGVLAERLGVGTGSTGFFEPVNIKSQGMDLPRPGMFLAGLAGGPASLEETIEQGVAAGLRAALYLGRPMRTSVSQARVNERICSGCGLCVQACPMDARHLDPEKAIAVVDPWLCAGCGTCVAACPNGASEQAAYEARGVLAALDAAID